MERFQEIINEVLDDRIIPDADKINLLNTIKNDLIELNSNRIMNKEKTKLHFDYLEKIDEALNSFKN